MTGRTLFLVQLETPFSVNVRTGWLQWRRIVRKNTAHVMQEPCPRQQNGGVFEAVHMVEEKLSVDVALRCREGKPADSGILVPCNVLAHQIQLAEGVLRILISLFSGGSQKLQGCLYVFWHILAMR